MRGVYDLIQFDGEEVPWQVAPVIDICRDGPLNAEDCPDPMPTECWRVLSDGGVTLLAAGGFEMRWEYTNSCSGETLQEAEVDGTYTLDADGAVQFEVPGPSAMTGALHDGVLEAQYGDAELVFVWVKEATSPTGPIG